MWVITINIRFNWHSVPKVRPETWTGRWNWKQRWAKQQSNVTFHWTPFKVPIRPVISRSRTTQRIWKWISMCRPWQCFALYLDSYEWLLLRLQEWLIRQLVPPSDPRKSGGAAKLGKTMISYLWDFPMIISSKYYPEQQSILRSQVSLGIPWRLDSTIAYSKLKKIGFRPWKTRRSSPRKPPNTDKDKVVHLKIVEWDPHVKGQIESTPGRKTMIRRNELHFAHGTSDYQEKPWASMYYSFR